MQAVSQAPSTDDHLYDFPAPHVLLRWPCRCRKRGLPMGYQSIIIRFHSHPTIHGTHRSPILTSSGSWALKTRLGKGRRGTGRRTIGRGVVTWLHNFLPSLFMFSCETLTTPKDRPTCESKARRFEGESTRHPQRFWVFIWTLTLEFPPLPSAAAKCARDPIIVRKKRNQTTTTTQSGYLCPTLQILVLNIS